MPRVIIICGKICSGKTTYAKKLQLQSKAILLSVDEIMLLTFGQHAGDRHDEYAEGVKKYLLQKSEELIECGIDVILDWGFWRRADRDFTKAFYSSRSIACELHYIDVDNETWMSNIDKRNREVLTDERSAYFVDEKLVAKLESRFEAPSRDEIDVWV